MVRTLISWVNSTIQFCLVFLKAFSAGAGHLQWQKRLDEEAKHLNKNREQAHKYLNKYRAACSISQRQGYFIKQLTTWYKEESGLIECISPGEWNLDITIVQSHIRDLYLPKNANLD